MSKEGDIDVQKLACKLTQDERELKTQELVRLEQAESKQKAAKKAAVAVMNGDLKQARASIDEIVKQLDEGTEVREVEVEAVFDYEAKRVEYRRRDTGETISTREMDAFDLQQTLPSEDLLPPPSKPQKRKPRKKHGELQDIPDNA